MRVAAAVVSAAIASTASHASPARAEPDRPLAAGVLGVGYEYPGAISATLRVHAAGWLAVVEGQPARILGREPDLSAGDQVKLLSLRGAAPIAFAGDRLGVGLGFDFEIVSVARGEGRRADVVTGGLVGTAGYAADRAAITLVGGAQLFGGFFTDFRLAADLYVSIAIDRRGYITPYASAGYGWYQLDGSAEAGVMLAVGLSVAGVAMELLE